MSYELGVMSYELGVGSYELGVGSWELGVMSGIFVNRKSSIGWLEKEDGWEGGNEAE